jgi:signal peptidase I
MTDKVPTPAPTQAPAPAATPTTTPKKDGESVGELLKTLLYAVLIAVGVRTIFYSPFNIPSESMLPNLLVGDYLFVAKFPYGYSRHSLPFSLPLISGRILENPVTPGDVVVFKTPQDNSTDFIKRIVAGPGDTVQVISGQLYLNGQPVKRERVADMEVEQAPYSQCNGYVGVDYSATRADGTPVCRFPQYRETLPNGASYLTLDLDPNGPNDNTRPYLVPAGHYFAMGDNRDNSQDSRIDVSAGGVGFVPAENVVGRADIIFFSTDGSSSWVLPWTWFTAARWNRFFNLI